MTKQRTVALVWYCRTSKGWRRFPVVRGANNRIRLGYVLIDGELTHCPVGRFEIRRYEGRKVKYDRAGTNAADATAQLDRMRHLVAAKDSASAAGVKLEEESTRQYIRKAAQNFVRDAEDRNAKEAAKINRLVMDEFIATCPRTFVDEISRDDILRFHAALRKRGLSDRTIANKDARLRSFIRFCKAPVATALPPKPKFEQALPSTLAADDLQKVLEHADEHMQVVIELGFKCGLREQEIMFLEWSDIDWDEAVLRVIGKPLLGFKVKDSEQRAIPIPQCLFKVLQVRRSKYLDTRKIVPTASGAVDTKLLRKLKRLARRAGLNCLTCRGCRSRNKECQKWQLHSLRRTYATTLARSGMDLPTVQRFMGHSSIETTMRYLQPASAQASQAAINKIDWPRRSH